MSFVISAIEAGHVGTEWYKSKIGEMPRKCKLCKTEWPCDTIRYARGRDSDRAKAMRGVSNGVPR